VTRSRFSLQIKTNLFLVTIELPHIVMEELTHRNMFTKRYFVKTLSGPVIHRVPLENHSREPSADSNITDVLKEGRIAGWGSTLREKFGYALAGAMGLLAEPGVRMGWSRPKLHALG
jgi:hypothetical protein